MHRIKYEAATAGPGRNEARATHSVANGCGLVGYRAHRHSLHRCCTDGPLSHGHTTGRSGATPFSGAPGVARYLWRRIGGPGLLDSQETRKRYGYNRLRLGPVGA
jgi:hypothetical protein